MRAAARAAAAGVRDPRRVAAIAAAAVAAEDVSAYAYLPGKSFGAYAVEQIAQQVEHGHRGRGRPTPGIVTVIRSARAHAVVPENVASLGVVSFHAKSQPGVVFL